MKTWKITIIVGAVLVATALVPATAFAHMGGLGFFSPYGTNTATGTPYGAYSGGMMGGRGGMMGGYGYGYGTTTSPAYSGQYGSGCHRWNGYVGSTNQN